MLTFGRRYIGNSVDDISGFWSMIYQYSVDDVLVSGRRYIGIQSIIYQHFVDDISVVFLILFVDLSSSRCFRLNLQENKRILTSIRFLIVNASANGLMRGR